MDEKTVKEHSFKRYNSYLDLNNRITDDYISARRLDATQLRNIIGQISVLSFAVLGLSFSLTSNGKLIQSIFLFYFGISQITAAAIWSLWYLALQTENSMFAALSGYKKNKSEINSIMNIEIKLMNKELSIPEYQKAMKIELE